MDDPGAIVRAFFERMEARDWDGAGRLLSPTIRIEFSKTGKRFDGANFLAMNRAYPEGWSIKVIETLVSDGRVAAQVRVVHEAQIFWCAGFYSVENGIITSGTEHWGNEGTGLVPEWRKPFVTN